MAYIITVKNPFEPLNGIEKIEHPGGVSINEYLRWLRPGNNPDGWEEFDLPTIVVINGKEVLRQEKGKADRTQPSPGWDVIFGPRDIVNFITIPQGPFVLIALLIVVVAIAVTIAFGAMAPKTPGELPASDPVFSTKGQFNEIRLGEPIEVVYGKVRMYPALASRPFFKYKDNDQFQYVLFCLGQGKFDVEEIRISDTDINDFEEVQYELIEPGGVVTLFPTNVITSVEVGGQTLFGTNESDWLPDGWVGPFACNPPNTTTTKLEIDVTFPKGLYTVDKKGNLHTVSIGLQWEARKIDDLGAPIGPGTWTRLVVNPTIVISGATTTPRRKTYTATVAVGRYETRLRRSNAFDPNYKTGNDAVWEGLRAFIDEDQNFGDVTLLAVIIRATNNLNERTQSRFNVIATRKLPIYAPDDTGADITGWLPATATRSIVWALIDVFKSLYGGRIIDNNYFDWDTFLALDAIYTARGDTFDWIFRDPITVWEAAQTVARAGRAVPLLAGSLITMRREAPLEIPVTMFTPDNIHKGSFQWEVKLWDLDEHDSIQVEYTEPDTGYKQEQVMCVLPGGTTDHPKDVRLPGISNRQQAYREGMFILAAERYIREQISFETGLEGHIPTYGDLIAIAHDVPRWGQHGIVVHAEHGPGDDVLLWISEPLDFSTATGEHVVMLRGTKSEILGPFTAYQTSDPMQVMIIAPGVIDFQLGGDSDPMLFLFGPTGRVTKYGKVVKIQPKGTEKVSITAVNYASEIYSFDELIAPVLDIPALPPTPPDLPVVTNVYVTQVSDVNHIIQVAWTAAFGAQSYIVQTSTDGVNYENAAVTTQTSVQLQVRPGALWVRVAGINNGQGPWATVITVIGVISGLDLDVDWEDLEWEASWWAVLNASGYILRIYNNDNPLVPVLKRTVNVTPEVLAYLYDYTMAVADGNVTRNMLLSVDPDFSDGPANLPSTLTLFNTIPPAPTAPGYTFLVEEPANARYRLSWTLPIAADLIRVKVWLSDTSLFDPEVLVPIVDDTAVSPGTANCLDEVEVLIPLDTPNTHVQYYWRVACFDVWGNEIDTNITDEQVIPPYP